MARTLRDDALFFEVAYARSKSMRVAFAALRYLVEWGRASDDVGRPLDVEEYAEHVVVSRSQAFRRQASFRRCFPEDDIATMWAIVRPLLDKRGYEAKDYGSQAVYVGTLKCFRKPKR